MPEEKYIREIFYYRRYYLDFFERLSPEVKLKFNWTLKLIATIERIPTKFFDHVTSTEGIYEIRVEVKRAIYRVFCFFDERRLIILMNGFQKKTGKTPRKEIELAERIKKQYDNEKG